MKLIMRRFHTVGDVETGRPPGRIEIAVQAAGVSGVTSHNQVIEVGYLRYRFLSY